MTVKYSKITKKFIHCWKDLRMSEARLAHKFKLSLKEVVEIKQKLLSACDAPELLTDKPAPVAASKSSLNGFESSSLEAKSVPVQTSAVKKTPNLEHLKKYAVDLDSEISGLEQVLSRIRVQSA